MMDTTLKAELHWKKKHSGYFQGESFQTFECKRTPLKKKEQVFERHQSGYIVRLNKSTFHSLKLPNRGKLLYQETIKFFKISAFKDKNSRP